MFKDIAFTVYAVTDITRSRVFYENILGLIPHSDFPVTPESKWIEYVVGNGVLSIGESAEWKPSQDGATVALETHNFDLCIKTLKEKGVSFFLEPQTYPSCSMAIIYDPDLNKILIHHKV